MADTQKTIQVNIDVVLNQAQQAFNTIQKATVDAGKSFDKMGSDVNKATDQVSKSVEKAGKDSSGFFNDMKKDILGSLAAYDLFKKGVSTVFGFFTDSVGKSMEANAAMAQVKVNVENAGLSYDKLSGQIEAYSKKQLQMGFDDEDTALSISRLAQVTGNYESALKLNQIAMDLSRSKNVDLATATTLVTQVTQGNGRVLKQYGISLEDTASAADNLAKLQDKVAGSSAAFAQTSAGSMQAVKQQWDNLKESVGDKLAPVLADIFKKFEDNLPQIEAAVTGLANGIATVAEVTIKAFPYIEALVGGLTAYYAISKSIATYTELQAAIKGVGIAATVSNGQVLTLITSLGTMKLAAGAAFGIIGAAATAAGVLITNAAQKTGEAWDEAAKAAVDAGTANFEWVKRTNSQVEAAEKTHSDVMIAYAKARQDWVKAIVSNASQDEIKKMNDVQQAALENLKKNADAYKQWQGIATTATTTVATGFEGVSTKTQQSQEAIDAYKKKMDDLKQAVIDVTAKQNEFSFKSIDDFGRFTKVLSDTKTTQDQWLASAKQGFDAFKGAITQVNSTIDTLKGKLDDAKNSFSDFVKSTTTDSSNNFAQIVFDAEQAVKDLPKKIQDAQANGQDTTDLQKQLSDSQAVIASSQQAQYQNNKEFLDQLAFLRQEASKNELDQAYDVMQRKIDAKKKETDEAIANIQKQITAAEDEKTKYLAAQDAMTKAFNENVKLRQKSSSAEISSLSSLTSYVNSAAQAYLALAAAMSKAGGAGGTSGGTGLPARASGGPVGANQPYLVGENGPELFVPNVAGGIVPNDKISAPNGGAIVININNPSVRNDSDINSIVESVMDALNRRDELAKMGAYK